MLHSFVLRLDVERKVDDGRICRHLEAWHGQHVYRVRATSLNCNPADQLGLIFASTAIPWPISMHKELHICSTYCTLQKYTGATTLGAHNLGHIDTT